MSTTRRAVTRAALLVLGLVALALGGCGGKSTRSTGALRLEREDLAAVAHALSRVTPSVKGEVSATKTAWPLVANGIPTAPNATSRSLVKTASDAARNLRTPALFEERSAVSITGPAAGLAGTLRSFIVLSARGWQMIGAAIDQIEHGSPASARFARANANLYVEAVYDAHFSLAQIGKQVLAAYGKLGGPAAFGTTLTQREVDALAQAYSETNDRLHPHEGVRLGS